MIENFDKRDAARSDHISPLQVKDQRSGEIYEARMFNYSYSGIYFESDGIFQKGTKIYICIQNSPYSLLSGVLEYYNGEVMWRKDLERPLFNYGYGIQLVSDSIKPDLDSNDAKTAKDSRKHPRKPFSRSLRFGTHKGISEGTTKNISASGVFIATEEKLEVGQLLKLNLPLKKGKTAETIGQIVWLNEEGFGIKFKKIK
ncbi:MAG: PilZ domain-containing protein [Cyclobacteriaceae bacterium]|nr:PilZ domain-containing protein [Cyclobacteriaceae bacterium]